jgi:hypothetical protein
MSWGYLGGMELVCRYYRHSALLHPNVFRYGIPSPLFLSPQLQDKPIHAVYLCCYGVNGLATGSPMVGFSPPQTPSAV